MRAKDPRFIALLSCASLMIPAAVITGTPAAATGLGSPPNCSSAFSGGSGTDSDPYRVASRQDLTDLNGCDNFWGSSFLQTANISMGGDQWTTTTGTDPDGGTAFSGTYDGGDYTISNLDISVADDYVGLFGFATGDIRNVVLDSSNSVSGENDVGALVGRLFSGTITNSSSAVDVAGVDTSIGGLVGMNYGIITDSHATGNVTGTGDQEAMGGLVGRQRSGARITNSYATGDVTGNDLVGGLIGEADGGSTASHVYATGVATAGTSATHSVGGLLGLNEGTLSNCYATGNAVDGGNAGGLVGNNSGVISNCYSLGTVDGDQEGGLVAVNSGSVANSFWDTVTSNQTTSAGGTGKTTSELKTLTTFTDAGWSITESCSSTSIWGLCSTRNSGYPYLTFYTAPPTPSDTFVPFSFLLPDGRECTSISPISVAVGSQYRLPGTDALCGTMTGSQIIGWTIPSPIDYTGAGSASMPFAPGQLVGVVEGQRFTAVLWEPVLQLDFDANIATRDTCVQTKALHTSDAGRVAHVWVPREDIAMAGFPASSSCVPEGYVLIGWNTAGDGSGETYELGAAVPEDWAEETANSHRLFAVWASSLS